METYLFTLDKKDLSQKKTEIFISNQSLVKQKHKHIPIGTYKQIHYSFEFTDNISEHLFVLFFNILLYFIEW